MFRIRLRRRCVERGIVKKARQRGGRSLHVEALEDQNLFGPWFSGPSWAMWKAVLKGAFAIPMTPEELALFRAVAQRDPPKRRVR